MNERQELLSLRRDVLVARSAMLRLRAARDVEALRESFTFSRIATSITRSTRARSMLFGTLMVVLGGKGLSRALRFAAAILAGAKLVRFVGRYAAPRPAGAVTSQTPEATP
ncbi:MAG TPA: hypothetical protein VLY46_14445 [Usitatibacter sp.]|nr:hypothetical protein [Usitatibacter sp.]